jgi:hypothetical protein
MSYASARSSITILALAALCFASCDLGPTILSNDELSALYELRLGPGEALVSRSASDGASSQDGLLGPTPVDGELYVKIVARPSAPDPARLELRLYDANGTLGASRSLIDASFRGQAPDGAASVKDILGELPPLALPPGLEQGYYRVVAEGFDDAGVVLFTMERPALVYRGPRLNLGLIARPGTASLGGAVLLKAQGLADAPAALWIRWLFDGQPVAEGFAADGADRLVWRVASLPNVHRVSAEAFPFQPPAGLRVGPYAAAALSVPVAAAAYEAPAWDAGLSYLSRARFEGAPSFESVLPPGALLSGRAYPEEALDRGFGYALNPGAALSVPSPAGRGVRSYYLTLSPLVGAGGSEGFRPILSRDSPDGGAWIVGLENGLVSLALGDAKLVSKRGLPAGKSQLAVRVTPNERGSLVEAFIDGLAIGSLHDESASVAAGTVSISYPALYHDYAELDGSLPVFRSAMAARHGLEFIAAFSADEGSLPEAFAPRGAHRFEGASLYLESGSVLAVSGRPEGVARFSASIVAGSWSLRLPIADGRFLRLALDGRLASDEGRIEYGTLGGLKQEAFELVLDFGRRILRSGSSSISLPADIGFVGLPELEAIGAELAVRSVLVTRSLP